MSEIIVDHLTVGPFQTNVYVVGCPKTKEGVIVDAGGDGPGLLAMLKRHGLTLTKILQTHAHIDHVAALSEVRAAHAAPIYLHPDDKMLYDGAPQQGMFFGIPISALPKVDHWLEQDQVIQIGALEAKVIHLPGHSPGSVIFYFEAQRVMLSGDVLFAGSIGRTDLPGGDGRAMMRSLKQLSSYPDEVVIYSGHGPKTTLGIEKRTNPFLRGL